MDENQRLYTPTFFLGFLYNLIIALHFTNNALYPLYVAHEGGGVTMIGLFMGVYSVSAVVGRPFIGILIDRYGVKPMLIFGSLALSLPALGFSALLDTGLGPLVWILRFIQGFGYGAHFSATFTLAAQIAPAARRNEAVAMYGISGLAGAMIGPYFGEFLIEDYGLHAFFLAMIAIGIVSSTVISQVKIAKRETLAYPSVRSILTAFLAPDLALVSFLALFLAISFAAPITFLAAVAKERGIAHFSLYFTTWGFAGIVIRFIGGRWGDRAGLRRVLVPGFILYGAGLLTIHFSYSLSGFIIAGLLCGFAHGISFPAITTLGYTLAPREIAGSAIAMVTGMMDAGSALTALALGTIAEAAGSGVIFPSAGAAALTAVVLLAASIRRHPKAIRALEK